MWLIWYIILFMEIFLFDKDRDTIASSIQIGNQKNRNSCLQIFDI